MRRMPDRLRACGHQARTPNPQLPTRTCPSWSPFSRELCQRDAQLAARAIQLRLGCAFADAERLADLQMRVALGVVHHEHGTTTVGKLRHRFLKTVSEDGVRQ